ncbi:MAG: 50S ribosomal protein L13 [Phycisphaerae bacterium]|jgi:large subunit ribosomal protein L13|nr:50S ribosomal protein L13 [Phycisphaerales bacterium]
MPRQTTFIKPGTTKLSWRHVDATKMVLGRLATEVATVLMGKHLPNYTPNVDCGEGVIVTNASNVAITGRKLDLKTIRRWSGYPGGLRVRNYRTVLADDPTTLVQEAIIRMLPRGRLGRKMRTRLRIFAGAEHTFAAQQPTKLVIKSRKAPATR